MAEPTLYDLLQVSPLASRAVIKAAYRSLAQQLHPDKNPGDGDAGTRLAAINRAFALLDDPVKRAAYDAMLGSSTLAAGSERRGSGGKPSNNRGLRRFVFRPL